MNCWKKNLGWQSTHTGKNSLCHKCWAVADWVAEVALGVKRQRDRQSKMKWEEVEENVEPSANVRGFWMAELHSWVTGHVTNRTARRMPNGPVKTDALLFCPSFPFLLFPLSVALSMSIFELLLYSCSLYSFMSPCIFHAALLMNSPTYSFFIWACFLCFCLYILAFLSHWSIADTVFLQRSILQKHGYIRVYVCVCVFISMIVNVYICAYICVCLHIGWTASEQC